MPDMNRFDKAAAARGAKKIDRTESWGASQKKKALSPADAGHNRFGKPNLPKERDLSAASAPAPRRTLNGKIESLDVAAARAAMEQGKIDAAHAALVRSRFNAVAQDTKSCAMLFEGWAARKTEFYPSPFNRESMTRAVSHVMQVSGREFGVALLDEVFDHLVANNFLEARIRYRGGRPANMYPEYVPEGRAVAPTAPIRRVVAEPTLPEGQNAKTMPLDELAKLVRAGYKPEGRQ